MDDAGPDAPLRAVRPARRAQTVLFWIILVVLVAGTAGGVLTARDRARDELDDQARRAGEAVAAVLEVELDQVAARLAGAGAVVGPAGQVDRDAFNAFADDPFGDDRPGAVVLIEVVTAADRPAFEAALGRPISVIVGGEVVPAPPAPLHHVAVAVVGAPPGRDIEGVDVGAEPARRRALDHAAARRRAALTGPVQLTSTGQPGVNVVRPVAGPRGDIRAFVTMGIDTRALASIVEGAARAGSDVALLDGDEVLVGAAERADLDLEERQVVPVDVPDRSWVVAVQPSGDPDLTLTWILAAAGVVAIATTGTLLVLTERHHRGLARANALLVRSEARSRAVQDLAGRLARALTGDEVASAIVEHLPAAVEASRAEVALVGRGGRVEVLRPGAESRDLVAPEAGSAVERVIATRRAEWLQSPLGWRGDDLATDLAGEASALALLPLIADDVAGVLAVGYPRVHIFGDDEQALLQTVAVLAARALARGRRYDAEHQSAVAFQRAALPDAMPEVPGLSIAARYRPAVHGATVGGDWYDAMRLKDGNIVLVVGDVVGHGMTAAAAMGRLRTAFQTIVPYRGDPGSMLQAISQHVDSIPDAFCATVVCAVLDVATGTMTWARAGHPPPLVVRAGGGTVLLEAPSLPPLGVAADPEAPVHQHQLDPGDVLLLYTDGVVERREESLDQGFRRLALVAEQLADLDVEEMADAVVEAMVPAADQADDLALLIVRVERTGGSGSG